MSASLYDTFGNEVRYQATLNTLTAYLDEATIKFALPEASSTFLQELADESVPVDQAKLDVVRSRLIEIGFKEANAKAMASVLMQVARINNVDPLDYFEINEKSLKLALDTYEAINILRPAGNRIGLRKVQSNQQSRYSQLIKP